MAELRRQEGVAARALEFAILTAARAGEVVGARWSELNLAERLWTVPGERMKAERDHRVPLSDAGLAVIEKMPRDGDYIFPGGRPGRPLSSMALLKVLDRMGKGDLTVHGFRATFSTWAAERGVDRDLAEMALAHTVGSRVERAYQRSDLFQKRRQLADTWARYCAATGGKVVAIRA